ncbi:coiled-coil domain-containing protein 43 [Neomonachus schauinslandi]|uniref:Coiled-coil domain-containing protein 43 n=1 Tax=Neomonachus schauinslandi TaxID=29088 RepID=A0A8M1MV87_NEOSC|nr:coiled-coil domain-containing protein 43 [Neomonachus schauinslandi]
MAAPSEVAAAASGEGDGGGSGFGSWLDGRLEALGVDRAVYGAYILGVLQEEEEEEKLDALQGILSAFLEEDSLLNICKEIVERWSESQNVVTNVKKEGRVGSLSPPAAKDLTGALNNLETSEDDCWVGMCRPLLSVRLSLTTLTEAAEKDDSCATTMNIGSDKSLFRNTNVEDVLNARKLERDSLRDESQRKKEQDKLQRERDKLAKQERKEKEKKRTQRGERKR